MKNLCIAIHNHWIVSMMRYVCELKIIVATALKEIFYSMLGVQSVTKYSIDYRTKIVRICSKILEEGVIMHYVRNVSLINCFMKFDQEGEGILQFQSLYKN